MMRQDSLINQVKKGLVKKEVNPREFSRIENKLEHLQSENDTHINQLNEKLRLQEEEMRKAREYYAKMFNK